MFWDFQFLFPNRVQISIYIMHPTIVLRRFAFTPDLHFIFLKCTGTERERELERQTEKARGRGRGDRRTEVEKSIREDTRRSREYM